MDQDNAYYLHSPNGTIDIYCDGDGCGKILPHPETGQYYCEVGFDGLSITSQPLTINSTSDDETPPTQLTTTAAQTPNGQIQTIAISVGGVGVLLLLALIVAIIAIIVLYRRIQNGYQPIPPDDLSKITHKLLYFTQHVLSIISVCHNDALLLPCLGAKHLKIPPRVGHITTLFLLYYMHR